ncbi:hypothetical protein [Moorena producens]|uniref:hypothetical protein n=1 Tax=Moorena producens TaxID=1155739 RepID=UPI003C73D80E
MAYLSIMPYPSIIVLGFRESGVGSRESGVGKEREVWEVWEMGRWGDGEMGRWGDGEG